MALDLGVQSGTVSIDAIRVDGVPITTMASPLFELRANGCDWKSDVAVGSSGETMSIGSTAVTNGTRITAKLAGCGTTELTLVISLVTQSDGNVVMSGTIANRSPSFSQDGWTGPDVLGPVKVPLDAAVTAVRSRMNESYQCRASDGDCSRPPMGMQEEAFVIGNDGIIYESYENDNGGWTPPTEIVDTSVAANRNVFPTGAPLVALRRNDDVTDLFSVGTDGSIKTFSRYAADDHAPWAGPFDVGGKFLPNAPIAALVLHEEFDQGVNEEEVYVAGVDGTIFGTHMFDNGSWSNPRSLFKSDQANGCVVRSGANLAALMRNHRQREIFWISATGTLCTAFRTRINDNPPDDFDTPWTVIPISGPKAFTSGASVAAAHGPGNDEYVFAVRASDSQLAAFHEKNDGPWLSDDPIGEGSLSSASKLSAARHTARDVAVAATTPDGGIEVMRTEDSKWQMPILIPTVPNTSSGHSVFANMRNADKLDVFGVGGDGRLFASTDASGRFDADLEYPKVLFALDDLTWNTGMVPTEMGGSGTLYSFCSVSECQLGMPQLGNSSVSGSPEAMNMMEVAHVGIQASDVSFFVADVSPSVDLGQSPAQLRMSADQIYGTWTKNLWPSGPGARMFNSAPLPRILFGGYRGTDWHPALDAFNVAHSKLGDPAPVATPDWLRHAGGMYTFSGGGAGAILLDTTATFSLAGYDGSKDFGQVIARMTDEAARLGTNVLYLWDYWGINAPSGNPDVETCNDPILPYGCKGDYQVRSDYGGAKALASAVDKLHQKDGKLILYVEPFVFGFGTDLQNQFGDLLTARFPGGAMWHSFPDTPNASYASTDWVDRLVQICVRLIRETHADGIFLDSAGWRANERVETKGDVVRASPYEHARGYLDLLDRIRTAINAVELCSREDLSNGKCKSTFGQRVVLGENIGGPAANHMDGGLSSEFVRGDTSKHEANFPMYAQFNGKLAATPTRYARKSVNIFSTGLNLGEMNQVYAAGHNLMLAANYEDGDAHPEKEFVAHNNQYIWNLVLQRKAHASALVDGDQSDIMTDNPDVYARYYRSPTDEVITLVNTGSSDPTVQLFGIPNPTMTPLRLFCDIVERTNITVANDGTIIGGGVDLPPAQDPCPNGSVCGLRVYVPGACP